MPNSRSRRTTLSKQQRQEIQRSARQADALRRSRRGTTYVASLGLVAILFVFGVLGQNLSNKNKKDSPQVTVQGHVQCPKADGSSGRQVFFEQAPGRCIDATKVYEAEIDTTAGKLTAEIYPSRAFNAANNFIFLARYHFYDGLPIHKVIRDTFVQSGDPVAVNVSGPGYVFKDDGLPASSSQYIRGALLFAHEAADLNGSQFLVITGNAGQTLRPVFPLFGQVKKGFATLDKINAGATNDPNTQQIRYSIKTIQVTEHEE
jgi:peptidylprolyl isomerase/peptidyl-prolyl cis-trans isomerase B (cyclophilin B)